MGSRKFQEDGMKAQARTFAEKVSGVNTPVSAPESEHCLETVIQRLFQLIFKNYLKAG